MKSLNVGVTKLSYMVGQNTEPYTIAKPELEVIRVHRRSKLR